MVCKTDTFWIVSTEMDLLVVHSGQDYWTNTTAPANDFPMSATRVASLLNIAFMMGMDAKAAQIKECLGVSS